MTPDDYCQQKAAASGSSFYYSFLFLPAEQRRAITALYAYCREVDDIVDDCQEPSVAHAKLNWWREETARLFSGQARHPVTRALQTQVPHWQCAEEYLFAILDGMQMDLEQTQYATFSELELYCYRVAGAVGLLAAQIFGYQHADTAEYARQLGTALQLTNILRDVREDADRHRIYIPRDELHQAGVSVQDLQRHQTTPALQTLFALQAQRARSYYQRAFAALPDHDRYAQRSGIIMAKIYQSLLDEIEKDQFRVLEHRVRLTPLRKFWLAWRTAQHEKKYRRMAA